MSYPLKGAFFQIANDYSHLYRKAVDALDCLKMKHIIIHTEAYLDEDNEPTNEVDKAGIDITLKRAAELDMKVWIGLVLPHAESQNGSYKWVNDENFMEMFTARSLDSVDRVWEKWGQGQYEKFDGFYLTYEGWTPKNHSELGCYFEDYLIEVSKKCRTKGDNLQIAISPFINHKTDNYADITEEYYKNLLPKTELTTVMMQDGVGAKDIPFQTVPAYMQAMKNACDHAGIEMWANVESFKSKAPTTFASLQNQIAAANKVTDQLVTFEFANYWLKDIGGVKAAELYTAYFDEFIKTPTQCRETPD